MPRSREAQGSRRAAPTASVERPGLSGPAFAAPAQPIQIESACSRSEFSTVMPRAREAQGSRRAAPTASVERPGLSGPAFAVQVQHVRFDRARPHKVARDTIQGVEGAR